MPDDLPRLKSVRVGNGPYSIDVMWADGEETPIDLTGLIWGSEHFEPLRDREAFKTVRMVEWGAGIEWPCGLDYGPDTLCLIAEQQQNMEAGDFCDWQAGLELSGREAADMLGVTRRTVIKYRKGGSPIPKSTAAFCRFLARDRTAFSAHYHPARRAGRPRG